MEPAKIDWKSINWVFAVDDLYEHINAPKWVDFSAPDESAEDETWFCRPDCNHPKTVEDFLIVTPPSKLQRPASVSEKLPLGDQNRRVANLRGRGLTQSPNLSNKDLKCDRFVEDGENQNPDFSTTPSHQYNSMKAAIKSSAETKRNDNPTQKEETPRLKSTLSAQNLFAGRDVLNQISEFCNELKRLATRAKDRENIEKSNVKKQEAKECAGDNLGKLDEREKERKPLLEASKEKYEAMEKSNIKEKQRRKKVANLKGRGLTQSPNLSNKDLNCDRFVEDGENQNPDFSTTPSHQYNNMKAAIKSSAETKRNDNPTQKEETLRLKSMLSARNLFAGRDVLNQISEFCNELKRLATRAKDRENIEKSNVKKQEAKECAGDNLGKLDEREKERKPLLEASKEKYKAMEKSNIKEKQRRKKRADEAENIPISVDLKNVKRTERETLLQIRTCPPSPQCFSASRVPGKAARLKASRSRPPVCNERAPSFILLFFVVGLGVQSRIGKKD